MSGLFRLGMAGCVALALCSGSIHAALIHRYSFDSGTEAKDSVGQIDGKLKNGAKIVDGKLVLKNDEQTSGDDGVSYVDLSGPILPKSGSVSIVVWFNAKDVGSFARVLDLGGKEEAEGRAFVYLVPRTSDDQSRAAITATEATAKSFLDNDRLDDGKDHMVALIIDNKAGKLSVSIDGKAFTSTDLGENTLDKVKTNHSWLGRSAFDNDPGFTGSIDELRIYDEALNSGQISETFSAGPNATPTPTTQPANAP